MNLSLLSAMKTAVVSGSSKMIGATVLANGLFLAATLQPAHSAAIYDFRTNSQLTTATRDFIQGGITLTVNNAQGNNILTALSKNGTTGGVNTDINNGLCMALFAGFTTGKCQYISSTAGDPTLTGLTFTFDKSVYLKGFDVLRPGGVEAGSLTFTAASTKTFDFTNPGGADQSNGVVFTSFTFPSNFLVEAGVPMTVSSVGTVFTAGAAGSFRINNLAVEEVPGPLPLLGFAGALGWSRRLRKKLAR